MAANNTISVVISAATNGIRSALSNVQSLLSGFTNRIRNLGSSLSNAFSALPPQLMAVKAGIAAVVTAVTAASAAVIGFGVKALQAAANTETLKAGLQFNIAKQLGGDVEAAKEKVDMLISEMQLIGESSAYDSNQLIPLARSWVNIGDSAETAVYKMQTITDAASAYGLTADAMERVNLALTQIQMKGKMQAEEMMQLTEAGIPAWTLLSEEMGKSAQELQDMASKGELTQEAMAALFNAMKNQTGGMAETLGNTLAGKFANIRESAENSLSDIGEIISKGLNIPHILDEVGEFVEGFRNHISNINKHAEEVGAGQAITDELKNMGLPGMAVFVETVMDGFEEIRDILQATLIPALEDLFGAVDEGGNLWSAIFEVCKQAVEKLILVLAGIIEIISLIIRAVAFLYDGFIEYVDAMASAVSGFCNYMVDVFGESFSWIGNAWRTLCDFLSNPIDLIVNVIWHDTKDGTSTEGNKIQKKSSLPDLPKFTGANFGKPSSAASSFGGGGGGRSGGGSQKEEWAGRKDFIKSVGNSVDEAVKMAVDKANTAASNAKNIIDPLLKSFETDKLGESLKSSYAEGRKPETNTDKFHEAFKNIGKKETTDPYAKIWEKAEKETAAIGKNLAEFDKYQKEVNKKAEEYSKTGERTRQMEEQRESALKRIADLQQKIEFGKGDDDTKLQIEREKEKLIRNQAKYEKEKAKAEAERVEASKAKIALEEEAAAKIESVRTQALEKINSRETALEAARLQAQKANNATNLADYINLMNEKDERTGQSYAAMLAQEEALNEQRQVWHEQLMLNAMEWGEYMSATLANLNQQIIDGLASGLGECIVQGKTLAETLSNLASNLLQNLINNVMKKWLTSLIGIGAQGKANAAIESANVAKTIAAEKMKTAAATQTAIAARIAAMPILPAATTATEVISAVNMGKVAGFASGGLVTGAGTSTSDSIPAMLSNGEFVIRAEAVQRLGTETLYALNEGKTFHYSSGGQVGKSSAGEVLGGNITLNVSAIDSESFETFLLRGGLDTIRQALYDNNRNFGSSAGVF